MLLFIDIIELIYYMIKNIYLCRMISLIQMEYVVAVDTYRHFGKAAAQVYVTQPTLSMQIKKMEEALGIVIFDRSKQPVVPTQLGKKIIAQARLVLQEAARLPLIVDEERDLLRGDLRIGLIPTVSPYLLPRFSTHFHTAYPHIKLKVWDMLSNDIIAALHHNQLDVGVLVTPIKEEGIFEQALYYEEMQLYAHASHPLMQLSSLSLSDISGNDIWLLNDGHCFRHQVLNLCGQQQGTLSQLPFEFTGGHLDTLIKIIDRDGGYTLVPELMALDMGAKQRKQLRSFAPQRPLREVSLIYTRKYEKAKLITALAASIRQHVPQRMWKAQGGHIVKWRS